MSNINMISLECPKCGGIMQYEKGDQKAVCPFCGNAVLIKEEQKPQIIYHPHPAEKQPKRNRKASYIALAIFAAFIALGVLIGAIQNGVEMAKATAADPFANLQVEFAGKTGSGTARIVNSNEGELKNVRFSLDRARGLSNGESVVVKAETLEGYRWTQDKKSFTVSGLSEPLASLNVLDEKTLEKLYEASAIQLDKAWMDVSSGGKPVEWNAEKHKLYLLVSDGSGKYDNWLFDTYKTTVTMPNGTEKEFYQAVGYTNIMQKDDGSILADYSDASLQNWRLGYLLGFDPSDAFYGWESLREMELEFESMQAYRRAE